MTTKTTRKKPRTKAPAPTLSQGDALDVGSVDDAPAEKPRTALVGDAEAPAPTVEAVTA